MIYYLAVGTVLGLSAGLSPGPLLTLLISETLRRGVRSGVKVALAPIVTDLPIILLTLLLLSKWPGFHSILGVISLAGGCFILMMGCDSIRAKGIEVHDRVSGPGSLAKGVLANALNPHPYLFWFTVGAPTMARAMSLNVGALLAFVIGFYTFLVGSKIMLALLVGKSKSLLSGRGYRYTMRFLGVVLLFFAFVLFRDGLKLLGL